jgi:CheY-like chemotaxis protein
MIMGQADDSPAHAADRELDGTTGVLLSQDLIFTAKVTGTARELGYRVLVGSNRAMAVSMIEQYRPRVVFVDLAAQDLAGPQVIESCRKLAGGETVFMAFGSHVDADALAAARAAGCDPVMPRSKFSAELPTLIPRLFRGHRD